MQITGPEEILDHGIFRVLDNEKNTYIARQLFLNKKPRSRIIADIKTNIEEIIAERKSLFEQFPYIHFEGIEQINGEYYLLRKGSEIYKPLYLYMAENEITLESVVDWFINIAKIAIHAEKHGIQWSGITIHSFWIDENADIVFLDPAISNELLRDQELECIKPLEIYQAPEIIKGDSWNQQSLIYSMGIIMYYLLTGEVPFAMVDNSVYSKSDLAHDIINLKPLGPSYLNPRITVKLNDFIISTLEKEPKLRTKDLKKFVQQLNEIKETGIYARKDEEEKLRKKAKRAVKLSKIKKSLLRFWYKKQKTIIVLFIIFLVLYLVNVFNSAEPYINTETIPQQVVEYFYQAIDEKNIVLLEETHKLDLKRLDHMVAETHVIEKVRTAYDMDGGSNEDIVFGINNLQILLINKEPLTFKAEYTFFYNEVNGEQSEELRDDIKLIRHEALMYDIFELEKIDGVWKIVDIKGSLDSIIEGRIMELFE